MDIKATKEWWNEICLQGKMTPDEAATLVHTVDDLIAEVERLTLQNELNTQENTELSEAVRLQFELLVQAERERDRYKALLAKVKAVREEILYTADLPFDKVWSICAAAEEVRLAQGSKWVLHLIGPDDVIDQPDELTALREANKLNIGLARIRAEDPSDHDPHCWAVVKNQAVEEV